MRSEPLAFSLATAADEVRRGTSRLLLARESAVSLAEVPLANGRRLDLLALTPSGTLTAVEIKSCRRDFLTDGKWRDYLGFADAFYFAVPPDFPLEILPSEEGVIVADRWAGEIVRPARLRPLAAARRRALLLRFARLAAARTMALADPNLGALDG